MIDDDRTDTIVPAELPIACSLGARDLSKRLADMRSLGHDALLAAHRGPRHAVLRFGGSDQTRARLKGLVAAEANCCAFLDFDLRDEDDAIVLTIQGPEGAESVVEDLVGAFAGREVRS